ncbi:MAG: hypothetical protein U1F98_11760 [Verrucomicrobiota bacterium]
MDRILEAEWLDELPPEDPRAVRSRRDLRRVNRWMGHTGRLVRMLALRLQRQTPSSILELGAGDGTLLLTVAQQLAAAWPPGAPGPVVRLVDRQDLVDPGTLRAYRQLGWRVEVIRSDVFDYLKSAPVVDWVIANLFLHHFDSVRLEELLRAAAGSARLFAALEPRRSAVGLLGSRMLWAIGCNDVTRHDAVVSVRAGFRGRELTRLWPEMGRWEAIERPAGIFSHEFLARRREDL